MRSETHRVISSCGDGAPCCLASVRIISQIRGRKTSAGFPSTASGDSSWVGMRHSRLAGGKCCRLLLVIEQFEHRQAGNGGTRQAPAYSHLIASRKALISAGDLKW